MHVCSPIGRSQDVIDKCKKCTTDIQSVQFGDAAVAHSGRSGGVAGLHALYIGNAYHRAPFDN